MAAHIKTGTMASPKLYQSYNLDHLGLVASMYDELGIGDLIDQMIYQDDDKRIVSLGQAIKAMVLNGLGFTNQTLYLMPHFFQNKPVQRLVGDGIEAEHLNDDVMGRAKTYEAIVKGDKMPEPGLPESFNVLMHELKGLGLNLKLEE